MTTEAINPLRQRKIEDEPISERSRRCWITTNWTPPRAMCASPPA
jgi:hypothetical protein